MISAAQPSPGPPPDSIQEPSVYQLIQSFGFLGPSAAVIVIVDPTNTVVLLDPFTDIDRATDGAGTAVFLMVRSLLLFVMMSPLWISEFIKDYI